MRQANFLDLLEGVLQLRGVAFERGALLAFVANAWPLIDSDPDLDQGAGEFLQASGA